MENLEKSLSDSFGGCGLEGLLQSLAGHLSTASMKMPKRLLRAQSWASGITESLVKQLFDRLQQHDEHAHDIFNKVEAFQLALEGIDELPHTEEGIGMAAATMDNLLNRIQAEPWSNELLTETTRC